jgi:hypothetical protein
VDYAHRKGMSLAEAERWLAPSLGYEPAAAASPVTRAAAPTPGAGAAA